eukprot:Gregarina_sp_Pseudo_9__5712@NODE_824_length_2160_cov_94_663366_g773_i0_p1_GENE_NODE_824_length_2160_cov_94_663366_g773_i0NODE_824_length_2160_cov_94_663366_g773_i0_p1_ORF_typecomplete_len329_score47_73_NODE_824_length_2160_cov_94_663366_g773_i0421028
MNRVFFFLYFGAGAFPIGTKDPISFTCEVRHQNSTLSGTSCEEACKKLCDTAGNGKRLQECLIELRQHGMGDCIYGFRQTIRLEPSRVCEQSVADDSEVREIIFELPLVPRPIVPRTSQPKGVQLTLETTNSLCSVEGGTAFSLEWISATPAETTEPPLQGTVGAETEVLGDPVTASPSPSLIGPPPQEMPAAYQSGVSTVPIRKEPSPFRGVRGLSSRDTGCSGVSLVQGEGMAVAAEDIQYVAANQLSLDMLSWGMKNWRDVGFQKSYLVIRSHKADCTLNTNSILKSSFTLSQFGTVKAAQSSALSFALPPSLAALIAFCFFFMH